MWVLVTGFGLSVGIFIGELIVLKFYTGSHEVIVYGLIIGITIGIFQFPIIRPYCERSGLWIVTTVVGWGVAFLLFELISGESSWLSFRAKVDWRRDLMLLAFTLGGLAGGFVTGALQWTMLRKRSIQGWWWILVSSVNWAVSGAIWGGFPFALLPKSLSIFAFVFVNGMFGLALSCIHWLLLQKELILVEREGWVAFVVWIVLMTVLFGIVPFFMVGAISGLAFLVLLQGRELSKAELTS